MNQPISQPKSHVYIGTGERTGFYTLRKVEWTKRVSYDGLGVAVFCGWECNDFYVKNLSTDPKQAESKAADYAVKYGLEDYASADFDLDAWGTFIAENRGQLIGYRRSPIIVFGTKHAGHTFAHVCETDPDFVHWMFDTCAGILEDVDAAMRSKRLNRLELTVIAMNEMIEDGRLFLPEKVEVVQEPEVPSNWIGEIGDKIEFQGTLVFRKAFDTQYGTNVIFIVKAENGDVVKFFSTSVTFDDVNRGDWIHLKGTVKSHDEDEYRDNNHVTMLNRVKCIDHVEMEAA